MEERKAQLQDILLTFKALSDETRLKILSLLKDGEACVCDIADTLGMTQPNISFHLSMLKESGLINDRKNGRWIHYSLNESDMFIRFLLLSIFERFKGRHSQSIKKRKTCS
jgi:ArsR family transcriptional regulator